MDNSSLLDDCRTILQDCRAGSTGAARYQPSLPLAPHPRREAIALDAEFSAVFVPSHSQVTLLDRAELTALERLSEGLPPAPLLERLLTAGLLAGPTPAEPPTHVLTAWLHLNDGCNLACSYCYLAKSGAQMGTATGLAAIATLIETAQRHGYRGLLLKYAGGEAALVLDLVAELHRAAATQCAAAGLTLEAGILSNGTTLTPVRLATISALGLRLMISLDGLGAHNGARVARNGQPSASAAQRGIEAALAAGLRPDISVTISTESAPGLADLVDWLLDRELRFSLNIVRSARPDQISAHDDDAAIIAGMRAAYAQIALRPPQWALLGALLDRSDLRNPHSRPCAAGSDYLVIRHDGALAACQMEIDRASLPLGGDPLQFIRESAIGVRRLPTTGSVECASCQWQGWCAGGCPVETARHYGSSEHASPNCAIYQALFPDLIRLEGLRLRADRLRI